MTKPKRNPAQRGRKSSAALSIVRPVEPVETTRRREVPGLPAHLSDASKTLWKSTLAGWDLDMHHQQLLRLACEALDLAEQARLELVEHGRTTITDTSGGIRAHPATAIARDNRTLAARLLRDLNLDAESGNAS